MISGKFATRRERSFFRTVVLKNYRFKLLVIAILVARLFILPSSIDRPSSVIHELRRSTLDLAETDETQKAVFAPFPFPDELEVQGAFWKKIFAHYTTRQVLIHDDWYVNVIYDVIDLDNLKFATVKKEKTFVKTQKEKYEKLLSSLSKHWGNPAKMTKEERRVYKLFKDIPESHSFKKKDAKDRVRAQVGQADRMKAGIIRAGQYLPAMKEIFAEYDLPEKLVYLPLIESAYNSFAISSVGAAGMWQFMRSTGKQYKLRITPLIDERKDPLRATRAAAQLLAHNYKVTQSWPLAITAYNFGLQGIKNATKKVKTENIVEIIEKYNGPRFGFSSRNFYIEFLIAVDVCLRYTEYFGEIELFHPLALTQVELTDYVSVRTLQKYTPLTETDLKKLNPALHESVFNRGGFIPKNYVLNVPEHLKTQFEARYTAIPKSLKYAYLPVKARHKVKKGQTLSAIAISYDTTVKAIMKTNGIKNAQKIRAGQVLKIPGGYVSLAKNSSKKSSTKSASQRHQNHQVKKGETLITIAKKYKTSVKAITSINGIKDPRKMKAGQILEIPAQSTQFAQTGTSGSKTNVEHRVKKGQTLSTIAKIHKTSVKAITKANDIKNPQKIKTGQVLIIPKG